MHRLARRPDEKAVDRAVRVDELDAIAAAFGSSVDLLLGRYGNRDELTLVASNLQKVARENAGHMGNFRELLASELADLHYYADLAASDAAEALIEATETAMAAVDEAERALATLAATPLRRGKPQGARSEGRAE